MNTKLFMVTVISLALVLAGSAMAQQGVPPPKQKSIIDISGTWHSHHGDYTFTQNGSNFTVVGLGGKLKGNGVIKGKSLTFRFKGLNDPWGFPINDPNAGFHVTWRVVKQDGNYARRILLHNGLELFR
jgi:hypothetical protein